MKSRRNIEPSTPNLELRANPCASAEFLFNVQCSGSVVGVRYHLVSAPPARESSGSSPGCVHPGGPPRAGVDFAPGRSLNKGSNPGESAKFQWHEGIRPIRPAFGCRWTGDGSRLAAGEPAVR